MRSFILIVSLLISLPAVAVDKNILVLGDSLSASYGIPMEAGWVNLLQERIQSEGYAYQVRNASITGETTAGAKVRITDLLQEYRPSIVIIELGGNDGLRGLSLAEVKQNLDSIIGHARQSRAQVLLIPMHLPTNYGPLYNRKFMDMYRNLAASHDVLLGKFILEGIGDDSSLMQDDGIHPTAPAQNRMLENIWPDLQTLLTTGEG